jgi:glycine oxidase
MSIFSDFTIIGSGINGLLTARELLKTGATVTIIEKDRLSKEASWAGGGILLPLYPWRQAQAITELVKISIKVYPELNTELLSHTGIDPEWIQCGLLITKNPDFHLAKAWCERNLITCLQETEAKLQAFYTDALNPIWLPKIAQVRNPRLLAALLQDLKSKKVTFLDHCSLQNIHTANNQVDTITTNQGKIAVNQLILTTGAWTGELWQYLFSTSQMNPPEIHPVKGQMLLFDAQPGLLTHMILDDNHYLIPRRDGKILAGSTVETAGFNKQATSEVKQRLYNFATRLFPALAEYPVSHHWAGLRPGTEHGIPYIDKHPEIDNLFINAGHFRNGLVMGPASAQLLTDLILNRTTLIDPTPFQLSAQH